MLSIKTGVSVVRLTVLAGAISILSADRRPFGPSGGAVEMIAVDPHNRNVVLAGTTCGLIYRSRDGGESWNRLSFPAELRATLHSLAIDPASANVYFAGLSSEKAEYAGLFRSRDAGATWQRLPGLANQQVWALAFFPADGRVIAAGTEDGLHLTKDGGETWRRISPESNWELRPVVSVAFDPGYRDVIYAGTPHLAWKTTDGGATWKSIRDGMSLDSDVFSIIVDRKLAGRVFASACSGIYRSFNGGVTWTKVSGPKESSIRAYFVAQHPSEANVLYSGTSEGLLQSRDGGTTWRRLAPHRTRGMAFDPATAGRVFIATDEAGVLRSDHNGLLLRDANQGIGAGRTSPIAERGTTIFGDTVGGAVGRGGFVPERRAPAK